MVLIHVIDLRPLKKKFNNLICIKIIPLYITYKNSEYDELESLVTLQ